MKREHNLFFSNHPVKYVEQLFSVSQYSPLSSNSWLDNPFSKPVPPVQCLQTFLPLSAFFFSHLWQNSCCLWIICVIEMLLHETQLIFRTLSKYFCTFSSHYNQLSHKTELLHINLNFFHNNNYYTKAQAIFTQNVAVLRWVNPLSWNLVRRVRKDYITTSQHFENIVPVVSIFRAQSHNLWDTLCMIIWCVIGNHGLGWKSKLFSIVESAKKVKNGILTLLWVITSLFHTQKPVL